jgi:aminoglycoside 3-N-acetyltransferase
MKEDISLLTKCGIIFKRLTGIKDISETRKSVKKKIGKLIYHKKYNADDIVQQMISLGMKKGSVVCIHAAMKEFYNFQGNADELIDKILEVISPEGTLLMPAFPKRACIHNKNFIFDPKTTPTAAGYLAETFRKRPGVTRSINTQHSVCAIGKYAKWLTQDHHKGVNCWDECSPWYRMTQLNALVFGLGLPANYIGTFDHCVEGTLYKEHEYWKLFFNVEFTFKYRNTQGEIDAYTCRTGHLDCRTHEQNLIKHFGKHVRTRKLSNLRIKVYDSKECLDKMIELGRKGITMYYVPSPHKYKF